MKPKLLVLVIVLLLVALVPALAMAQSQAKPQGTGKVILDLSKPIGPVSYTHLTLPTSDLV